MSKNARKKLFISLAQKKYSLLWRKMPLFKKFTKNHLTRYGI